MLRRGPGELAERVGFTAGLYAAMNASLNLEPPYRLEPSRSGSWGGNLRHRTEKQFRAAQAMDGSRPWGHEVAEKAPRKSIGGP